MAPSSSVLVEFSANFVCNFQRCRASRYRSIFAVDPTPELIAPYRIRLFRRGNESAEITVRNGLLPSSSLSGGRNSRIFRVSPTFTSLDTLTMVVLLRDSEPRYRLRQVIAISPTWMFLRERKGDVSFLPLCACGLILRSYRQQSRCVCTRLANTASCRYVTSTQ